MADDRDTADDATRLSGIGGNDETRFTGVAAAPRTAAPAAAGTARSESSLAPGALLGHTYRIEALLARGGMGEVYRARHAELDTDHAIKIILPELANDQRIVDLFRREAAVLRTIRHDAVVAYDGVFRDENGRLYLVMEFVDGLSLSKLMHERTFGAEEIRELRNRLADGLAVAHEKGVIHRDISPDNVILPGGQVSQAKIIDFGISKLADPETKTIIGTDFAGKYSYVSPEQLGMYGGQIDGRSDIYSLGLVLVAAAQGEALDMGQSPISVIEARRSVPDLSRVPEAVRADLAAMLQPDPADRPQSMQALVGAAPRQGTRPAKSAADAKRPTAGGRGRLVPILGAVAVVALAAGGGWYWYEFLRTDDDVVADSGQQGGTATTTSTTDGGSTQAQVTDQTGMSAATGGGATDATSTNASGSSTDATTVAADGDQTGTGGTTTADQSVPIVDAADSGTTTSTGGTSSAATDSGQSIGTDVALLPQTLDVAKLRDDANRAVQGLSCADIRIDVSASGDIAASGYAGGEADREQVTRLLKAVANVGQVENALVVMKRPACEAVDIVRAETAYGAATAPRIDPGGVGGVYREDENLKVTVTAMTDGYLYVDYVDAENDPSYVPVDPNEPDRYVLHLLPNSNWRPEQRPVTAGEQVVLGTLKDELENYVIEEPFGTYVIIAISSPEPLFDPARFVQEAADAYLPDLRARLAEMGQRVGRENLPATSTTIVFQKR